MSETFVNGHIALIKAEVQTYCNSIPLIAIMMFFVSAMVVSRAATTLILLPLGPVRLPFRLCVNGSSARR